MEAEERRRYVGRHRLRRLGVAAGLLVVVGAATPPALAVSPVFAVRTIAVPGASASVAAAVRAALAPQLGRPVALVSDQDVAAAVQRVPAVERFAVVRLPPSTLEVRVTQRVPVVQERISGGWVLEDAAGVALGTQSGRWPGVPPLTMSAGAAGRSAVLGSIAAATTALDAKDLTVTAASASGPNDLVLRVGGASVRWGGAERPNAKAEALAAALRATPSDVSEIDVSSPGLVQTR